MVLLKSLNFWTLLVGVAAFVAHFYFPAFPLDNNQILSLVLFALGLIGVFPALRANGLRALASPPILNSLAFIQLLAGLVAFVLTTLRPDAPITKEMVLGVFLFVLGLFQIHPELRARNII